MAGDVCGSPVHGAVLGISRGLAARRLLVACPLAPAACDRAIQGSRPTVLVLTLMLLLGILALLDDTERLLEILLQASAVLEVWRLAFGFGNALSRFRALMPFISWLNGRDEADVFCRTAWFCLRQ